MSSPELQQLLRVLDELDLGLSRDDVAWAFESRETKDDITRWVREYLSPATLLTHEELHFHESKARNTSTIDAIPGNQLSDESLDLAINALDTSTASVEKQCRLLEAQTRAIEEILRRNASGGDGADSNLQRRDGSTHEKAQLEFEQSELTESLRSKLGAAMRQMNGMSDSMPSNVEKIFEKDDRLLDGIEKVLPELSATDDASRSLEEVDRLSQALVVQSSADIRSQIDATYRHAVEQIDPQMNGDPDDDNADKVQRQRETLQSELEELCGEIDGLSTMAVDNQYRSPISRALRAAREDKTIEKATKAEYVTSVLRYLTTRLDAMNHHFQHLHAHSDALKAISADLDAVTIMNIERKQTSRLGPQSPPKESPKGLKPLRLVQANLSENQDPVAQLLKQLDVRISDPANLSKLSESLSSAAGEQQGKVSCFPSMADRSLTDQVSQSLAKSDGNVEALLDAVLAHSKFGTVKLLSSELEEGVAKMEEKTQRIGGEMRTLDVNDVGRDLREKQQIVVQKLRK